MGCCCAVQAVYNYWIGKRRRTPGLAEPNKISLIRRLQPSAGVWHSRDTASPPPPPLSCELPASLGDWPLGQSKACRPR